MDYLDLLAATERVSTIDDANQIMINQLGFKYVKTVKKHEAEIKAFYQVKFRMSEVGAHREYHEFVIMVGRREGDQRTLIREVSKARYAPFKQQSGSRKVNRRELRT